MRMQLFSWAATNRIRQYISTDDQSDTIEYVRTEERNPIIKANLPTEVNYGHHRSKTPKQNDIKKRQTENIKATHPTP